MEKELKSIVLQPWLLPRGKYGSKRYSYAQYKINGKFVPIIFRSVYYFFGQNEKSYLEVISNRFYMRIKDTNINQFYRKAKDLYVSTPEHEKLDREHQH
jgi:hypothetical protein